MGRWLSQGQAHMDSHSLTAKEPPLMPTAPGTDEQAGECERARIHHLTQLELARRWAISPRTLERWRSTGRGPNFLRLGRRVVYRLEDIEAFELASRHEIHAASRSRNTKA